MFTLFMATFGSNNGDHKNIGLFASPAAAIQAAVNDQVTRFGHTFPAVSNIAHVDVFDKTETWGWSWSNYWPDGDLTEDEEGVWWYVTMEPVEGVDFSALPHVWLVCLDDPAGEHPHYSVFDTQANAEAYVLADDVFDDATVTNIDGVKTWVLDGTKVTLQKVTIK